jgi:hypothetical protein
MIIKYQKGIIALDLRFILNDPSAVKGKKNWENLGELEASKVISDDQDPRMVFIQAKRSLAVLSGFIKGLQEYTDEHFDKHDKSFMGVTLQWANSIGGGTKYRENEQYKNWLEDIRPHKEELEKLIRIATEKSRNKGTDEKWEDKWINPLTGEELIITPDDAVTQGGRSGFKYSI